MVKPQHIILLWRIGLWLMFLIGLVTLIGGLSLLYLDWVGWQP